MASTKILVVEDEGLTAMELQRKLKFWGYDVPTFVFSGKEAIKKVEEIKPDLILMDIVIKGQGDGIDAAQEIKNKFDIPIIYLTAYGDKETRERAEKTKPHGYLLKPFEENELHQKIEEVLLKHGLEKKLIANGKWLDIKLKNLGVIVIDSEGYVRFINKLASDILGLEIEDAKFKELTEVFPIEGIEGIGDLRKYLNKLVGAGKSKITTRTTMKTDHIKLHLEYSFTPITDDQGEMIGANLVFEDITQHVMEEQSLLEIDKRFKSVYAQSTLATEIFDEEGGFLDANPACLDLMGVVKVEDLQEFNLFTDFKLSSEEQETLKNGRTVKYEIEFDFEEFKDLKIYKPIKSGVICLEIIISPLKVDEIMEGYLVQFQDITKHRSIEESLKKSRDEYLKILENLNQSIIVLNKNLEFLYSNNAAEQLLEFKADEFLGKSIAAVIPSLWDEDLEEMCLWTLEKDQFQNKISRFLKEDQAFYIEISTQKSDNSLIILFNDVTEIKNQEEILLRSESIYRAVVEDQSEIICRFTPDGVLTFTNEAYTKYFGSMEDMGFLFALDEEGRQKMILHLESFDKQNPIKLFESPIEMPNGDIRWWQWVTKAIFDETGCILEFQSVGHEITQQHVMQEELQNQINKLQWELEEKNAEFKGIEESLQIEIQEIQEKERVLKEKHDELTTKLENTTNKLQATIKKHEDELKIHQDTEEKLNKKLIQLEKEIVDKTNDFNKIKEKLTNEIEQKNKIEEDLKSTCLKLENKIEKTTKDYIETKDNLEMELKNLKSSESSLKLIKERLETELKNNQEIMAEISEKLELEKSTRLNSEKLLEETKKNLQKTIKDKENEIIQIKAEFMAEKSNLKAAELRTKESLKRREKNLKDVYKRLQRNVQMTSSLSSLQSEYILELMVKQFQDGRSHLKSIGLVYEKLYKSDDLESINFQEYLDSLLEDISRTHGAKGVKIITNAKDVILDMDTAVSCGLIISELVINSLKHGFINGMKGEIRLNVSTDSSHVIIKVSDNGLGLPSKIDIKNPESFGLQLIKTFVDQDFGDMEIIRDNGTQFIIRIPREPIDKN
jgi:PAS domain S-box-containing protein